MEVPLILSIVSSATEKASESSMSNMGRLVLISTLLGLIFRLTLSGLDGVMRFELMPLRVFPLRGDVSGEDTYDA